MEFIRMPPAEVVSSLHCDMSVGLDMGEVRNRQALHGPNEMSAEEEEPLYLKYIEQFKDPLIMLLLGSAVLSAIVGQMDDALSIAVAVLIVSTVAFVQEYRSEQSIAALSQLVPHRCNVLRNGQVINITAKDLVPGDIVCLHTGDRVPADCRVVTSANLQVDESSLTGETVLCLKVADALDISQDAPIPDQRNMVFMSTLVSAGNARCVVVATGTKTEFGKTFEDMKEVESRRTPLQIQMDELGKQLSVVSFAVIAVIALAGILQGKRVLDMFTMGVSLAVAAIPEGLPICVCVTLALGVQRMATKNAIVKKLPAVEALGCADVVCTDKTGTLTENRMTVTQLYCPGLSGVVSVTSNGPSPIDGAAFISGQQITMDQNPSIKNLIDAGCVCNNASLNGDMVVGQPTEGALLVLAARLGVADRRSSHTFEKLAEVPFDSDAKRMEVKAKIGNGVCYFVKGAVEVVLDQCTSVSNSDGLSIALTPQLKETILGQSTFMAEDGLRVLAVASGPNSNALTFMGCVGIEDPPRANVAAAVNKLRKTGVRVIMITGDSKETARAIGQKVGCFDPLRDRTLCGKEIEQMSSEALGQILDGVTVCYRTSPRHKLMIVSALQLRGHVVAMTGDGVNDAPALKAADIGVAMGKGGTDVAKEAAHMVIVDDNFSTILSAIDEGKCIYHNIKNFVTFQLSTSVAALALVAICNFLSLPNPLNPMQVLWINIIMDGPPAQSLGVEPVDPEVVRKPPRKRSTHILTTPLLLRVLTSGLLIVIGTLYVFVSEMKDGAVSKRDTTMTFTTFVMFDLFNALCCRHNSRPVFGFKCNSNKPFLFAIGASLLGQLLVIYFPPLQRVFQTEAISLWDVFFIILVTSSLVILDSIRKTVFPQTFTENAYAELPVSPRDLFHLSRNSNAAENESLLNKDYPDVEAGTGMGKKANKLR